MKRDHETKFNFYKPEDLYERLEEIYKRINTGKVSLPAANAMTNTVREQTNIMRMTLAKEAFSAKFGSMSTLKTLEISKMPNTKLVEQNKTQ